LLLHGRISVPLVDDVDVQGKTPTELKAELTDKLAEYVTAPHVTVVVRQINSKLVFVMGEVKREGPIQLRRDMRVIDALSTAGGFTAFAGKGNVKLIREQNGSGPVEFVFDYNGFVRGENLEQNVLLMPGDRIVVPDDSPFWR
jgi:polysaccharide export outer membrane protein